MQPKAYVYGHPESSCAWYQTSEGRDPYSDGCVELLFIMPLEETKWLVTQEDWQHCAVHYGAYGAREFSWHGFFPVTGDPK